MDNFKLGRTNQCDKCPWKVGTDPYTIPSYNPEHHADLSATIAVPGSLQLIGKLLPVMSCHESRECAPQYCIGWLNQQLNEGNNEPLRLKMRNCENLGALRTVGPQHETFEATLPR